MKLWKYSLIKVNHVVLEFITPIEIQNIYIWIYKMNINIYIYKILNFIKILYLFMKINSE
jgi:hypothetical protein